MPIGTTNESTQKSKIYIDGKLCKGEFCQTGRSLNLEKDLELPNMNQDAVKFNIDDERIQERERAARMARVLLSESEMTRLEESGKLIDLRIVKRINPIVFKTVSIQSIVNAHKEHRVALAKLFHAEGKGLIPLDAWNSYLNALISSRESRMEQQTELNKVDKKLNEKQTNKYIKEKKEMLMDNWQSDESLKIIPGIPNKDEASREVCGICGNVYKLLDHIRFLLSKPDLKQDCNYNSRAGDGDQEKKNGAIFSQDIINKCKTKSKLNYDEKENYYEIRFSDCNHYMSFLEFQHMITSKDKTGFRPVKAEIMATKSLSSYVVEQKRLKTMTSEKVPKFDKKV